MTGHPSPVTLVPGFPSKPGTGIDLKKRGLGPEAAILDNYGIDSETDLLVLDQDDFRKLASRGLKPLHAKKLERWCGAVRERAEKKLPWS